MRKVEFKSTLLDYAIFEPERQVITVRFRNSPTLYEYSKPEHDPEMNMEVFFISFCSADSAGQFFLRNIKNKLPFNKVETPNDK